ncbi:MAG: Hsp33 family molecular chaperone HslO, partial [Myxococcaceae bacterium]
LHDAEDGVPVHSPVRGALPEARDHRRVVLDEDGSADPDRASHRDEPRAHQAQAVLRALFDRADVEVTSRMPVRFKCRCGRERVLGALSALGKAELEDLLAKEGKAEVTCDFCGTQYTVPAEEIRGLIAQLPG